MKMNRTVLMAFSAVAWLIPLNMHAMVLTTSVRVTKFHTYTDYGNGDVVFNVDATFAGCDGFWLSPADPGFKQAYAALMMVKAAGMSVVVFAYDTQLWPGSGDKYCRVRTLTPE
jgi:hypothetical protein